MDIQSIDIIFIGSAICFVVLSIFQFASKQFRLAIYNLCFAILILVAYLVYQSLLPGQS